jgi:hypothetical protein
VISAELKTFLESGISVLVGTRAGEGIPDCARAVGAQVGADGTELAVFLPETTGATCLEHLRDNGRIAVCVTRPADHRSIQIKGSARSIRPAKAHERAFVESYLAELAKTLAGVGLPERLTLRVAHWPCQVVCVRVESLFLQTPGPEAGTPIAAAPAEAGP